VKAADTRKGKLQSQLLDVEFHWREWWDLPTFVSLPGKWWVFVIPSCTYSPQAALLTCASIAISPAAVFIELNFLLPELYSYSSALTQGLENTFLCWQLWSSEDVTLDCRV